MQKKITVNGQIIPPEAVQYELERLVRFHVEHGMSQDQIRAQLPELVKKATEQAIGAKLLMDEAGKWNIPVTEAEVDVDVARIVEQVGGKEPFQKALQAQNTTLETFRKQLKQGKRVEKLLERHTANVAEPTEADMREHFDSHKDEYVQSERVLAQHILITPDGDTQHSKDEAHAKITAIRERIADGAQFSDEAAAHSMCPSGKEGGSLGWFGRGMMVPEFEKAAFAMQIGDVSEIIETQFGYHIIYKSDVEAAAEPEFAEVRDKIRDFLLHVRRGESVARYVEELRGRAAVEIS